MVRQSELTPVQRSLASQLFTAIRSCRTLMHPQDRMRATRKSLLVVIFSHTHLLHGSHILFVSLCTDVTVPCVGCSSRRDAPTRVYARYTTPRACLNLRRRLPFYKVVSGTPRRRFRHDPLRSAGRTMYLVVLYSALTIHLGCLLHPHRPIC